MECLRFEQRKHKKFELLRVTLIHFESALDFEAFRNLIYVSHRFIVEFTLLAQVRAWNCLKLSEFSIELEPDHEIPIPTVSGAARLA